MKTLAGILLCSLAALTADCQVLPKGAPTPKPRATTTPTRAARSASARTIAVKVTTDDPCVLTIDGKPQGDLTPGVERSVSLSRGGHKFEAVSRTEVQDRWEATVDLSAAGVGRAVTIELLAVRAKRVAEEAARKAAEEKQIEEEHAAVKMFVASKSGVDAKATLVRSCGADGLFGKAEVLTYAKRPAQGFTRPGPMIDGVFAPTMLLNASSRLRPGAGSRMDFDYGAFRTPDNNIGFDFATIFFVFHLAEDSDAANAGAANAGAANAGAANADAANADALVGVSESEQEVSISAKNHPVVVALVNPKQQRRICIGLEPGAGKYAFSWDSLPLSAAPGSK